MGVYEVRIYDRNWKLINKDFITVTIDRKQSYRLKDIETLYVHLDIMRLKK